MAGAGSRLRVAKGPACMHHMRVVAVATIFGLAAYAVVQGLVQASRWLGVLDWIAG